MGTHPIIHSYFDHHLENTYGQKFEAYLYIGSSLNCDAYFYPALVFRTSPEIFLNAISYNGKLKVSHIKLSNLQKLKPFISDLLKIRKKYLNEQLEENKEGKRVQHEVGFIVQCMHHIEHDLAHQMYCSYNMSKKYINLTLFEPFFQPIPQFASPSFEANIANKKFIARHYHFRLIFFYFIQNLFFLFILVGARQFCVSSVDITFFFRFVVVLFAVCFFLFLFVMYIPPKTRKIMI